MEKRYLLTDRNLIPQMRRHAREHSLTLNFADTLAHMLEDGPWRVGKVLRYRGHRIDPLFAMEWEEDFESYVGEVMRRGRARYGGAGVSGAG